MSGDGIGVLIVDDDPHVRCTLGDFLELHGYRVRSASTCAEALGAVDDGGFRILLLDLRLPDGNGVDLGQRILERDSSLCIIILTAYSAVETAMRAVRYGMYDYLAKPVEPDDLLALLARAVERLHLAPEPAGATASGQDTPDGLIGRSASMRRVRDLISAAARSDIPVLICGETGTGKELVARAVHAASESRAGPFVGVNCAAVPEQLIESELFGHVRGAFTGALAQRRGQLASAGGGTLFLDELTSAPLGLQAKLLRALQERVYQPVGSDRTQTLTCRIIAAVSQDPHQLIAAGRLRGDLHYRIGALRIDVPPLRERLSDLPLLVDGLLRRLADRLRRPMPRVSSELLAALHDHAWPGNVRELENVLSTMLALSPGDLLTPASLPPDYQRLLSWPTSGGEPSALLPAAMESFERQLLKEALRRHGGSTDETAKELGIEERSLRRKLRRLGIDWHAFQPPGDERK